MPDDSSPLPGSLTLHKPSERDRYYQAVSRMNWCRLRAWGSSRIFRASSLVLVTLPIIYRLLKVLGLSLPMTTAALIIHLTLRHLYFAALAFLVAQLVYELACPGIVKAFPGFAEYRRSHPGTALLSEWITYLAVTLRDARMAAFAHELVSTLRVDSDPNHPLLQAHYRLFHHQSSREPEVRIRFAEEAAAALRATDREDAVVADTFNLVSRTAAHLRGRTRVLCTVLMFISILFVALALLDGSGVVLKATHTVHQ